MSAFAEFVERYGPAAGEEGPILFVCEVFGGVLVDAPGPHNPHNAIDPWQQDVLRAFGRGERGISIAACHGPGKTAVAAWCSWLMLLTRFPQKTVATAPSSAQLKGALVPEVKMWGRMLPQPLQDLFEVKAEGIYLKAAPESSFFEARTARAESPEALQGVHSDNVLLIADEASGVPEAIFEAAKGSMSGHNATTLLLSNPTRTSGTFFDTHHKIKQRWYTKQISYKDSSRVTAEFARDLREQYGENSNMFRVRALGEFPTSEMDKIVSYEDVISAQNREIVIPDGVSEVWGVDVARFGDDESVLVRRSKLGVSPLIESWQGRDTMYTSGRIKKAYDDCPPGGKPETIFVDVIGIGSGVVDRLREMGLPARGVNVSEVASMNEQYRNLRTELWHKVAEWLAMKDKSLPSKCICNICQLGNDQNKEHAKQLAEELVAVGYDISDSSGKVVAEPKSETRKNLGRSPNIADALIMTFAGEPSTLLRGSEKGGWQYSWNQPIRRNRSLV